MKWSLKDILFLGLTGAGVYLAWITYQKTAGIVDDATTNIANLWLKMFPLPPAVELLGNVIFPGNIRVPIQQLSNSQAIRQDANKNVFVKYADHLWQLAPGNEFGNWPATMVK